MSYLEKQKEQRQQLALRRMQMRMKLKPSELSAIIHHSIKMVREWAQQELDVASNNSGK